MWNYELKWLNEAAEITEKSPLREKDHNKNSTLTKYLVLNTTEHFWTFSYGIRSNTTYNQQKSLKVSSEMSARTIFKKLKRVGSDIKIKVGLKDMKIVFGKKGALNCAALSSNCNFCECL